MEDDLQRVKTKGSQLKKDYDFKAIVFSGRKKTDHQEENVMKERRRNQLNTSAKFDIKKATKEVIRLGAGGFYRRRREKTLQALAVELGAKPTKRPHHNYSQLKEMREQNCRRQEERIRASNESTNTRIKQFFKKRSKSDNSLLNKYGKKR